MLTFAHSVGSSHSFRYPRTAFISNLNFETDEEKLKSVLGGCGTIVEVRLNRKGPKRFAYVQFETAEAVRLVNARHVSPFYDPFAHPRKPREDTLIVVVVVVLLHCLAYYASSLCLITMPHHHDSSLCRTGTSS